MTRADLLPCPFCGGDRVAVVEDDFATHVTGEIRHSVICNNLSCRAGQYGFGKPKDAIAAWNRRAPVLRGE